MTYDKTGNLFTEWLYLALGGTPDRIKTIYTSTNFSPGCFCWGDFSSEFSLWHEKFGISSFANTTMEFSTPRCVFQDKDAFPNFTWDWNVICKKIQDIISCGGIAVSRHIIDIPLIDIPGDFEGRYAIFFKFNNEYHMVTINTNSEIQSKKFNDFSNSEWHGENEWSREKTAGKCFSLFGLKVIDENQSLLNLISYPTPGAWGKVSPFLNFPIENEMEKAKAWMATNGTAHWTNFPFKIYENDRKSQYRLALDPALNPKEEVVKWLGNHEVGEWSTCPFIVLQNYIANLNCSYLFLSIQCHLANYKKIPLDKIKLDTPLREELLDDSLDIIECMEDLEKHYNCKLEDADVDDLETIRDVVECLLRSNSSLLQQSIDALVSVGMTKEELIKKVVSYFYK